MALIAQEVSAEREIEIDGPGQDRRPVGQRDAGADLQEVDNAVNQVLKEIATRYDFRGSIATVEFDYPGKSQNILNAKSMGAYAEAMQKALAEMEQLQYKLYAERKHSLLIILQAMDAGGKDGVVRKAAFQRLPDRLLGHLAIAEYGFFRNAFHRCSIKWDFG